MQYKVGLVLEGGAMRGMFTAGVLDVLMENNIKFDGAIGVSAGAVFGCNYKSEQIGRTIRYNLKFCNDYRYCSLRSLITTGNLFGETFCYDSIPNHLDIFNQEVYKNNPMEFYVVCTNVSNGKPVYKKCDNGDRNDMEWFRASASMPVLSKIVEIGEYKLLDGGISDPIPLKWFRSMGYDFNVVILTQPENYIKKYNPAMPLIKKLFSKYPEFIDAMSTRHNLYNAQREYVMNEKANNKTVVIQPPYKLNIGRIEHDPNKLKDTYELGRITAIKSLKRIEKLIGSI